MITYLKQLAELIHQLLPFSGPTWFVIILFGFCVWVFGKANKNPANPVRWEDLIIDVETNKTSPYKVGYMIGVIVSTWVVIRISDSGTLTMDIFGTYLAYLLGGAGFSTFVRARYFPGGYPQPETPYYEQNNSPPNYPYTSPPGSPYNSSNNQPNNSPPQQ